MPTNSNPLIGEPLNAVNPSAQTRGISRMNVYNNNAGPRKTVIAKRLDKTFCIIAPQSYLIKSHPDCMYGLLSTTQTKYKTFGSVYACRS